MNSRLLTVISMSVALVAALALLSSASRSSFSAQAGDCTQPTDEGCLLDLGTPISTTLTEAGEVHVWWVILPTRASFAVNVMAQRSELRFYIYGPEGSDYGERIASPGSVEAELTVMQGPAGPYQIVVDSPTSETGGYTIIAYLPSSVDNIGPRLVGDNIAVWDPAANRLLVLAGRGLGDLWAYSPSTGSWTHQQPGSPSSPALLSRAGGVINPATGEMSVFGGLLYESIGSPATVGDQLFVYDPVASTWTEVVASGPRPRGRQLPTLVWDPEGQQILLFGGGPLQGAPFNDLWAFRPSSSSWVEISSSSARPTPRLGSPAVWDPVRSQVLLYGGGSGPPSSELWSYRPSSNIWQRLEPSGPSPGERWRHTLAWDGINNRMLLFGGCVGVPCRAQNDLWSYDPAVNGWAPLRPRDRLPAPRSGHSAVWDSSSSQMIIVGGSEGDVWAYRPGRFQWIRLDP